MAIIPSSRLDSYLIPNELLEPRQAKASILLVSREAARLRLLSAAITLLRCEPSR